MRNILKQSSYLFFAQALIRVISFFYIIFLARILGVADFGLYTVALAYFSLLASVADFGFNRFLVREVAKDQLQAAPLLSNVTILRLTLTTILFAGFAVFLYLFDQDKFRVSLILLSALAVVPQSIALTFDGIFVALKKLQFSSLGLVVSSLLTAGAGLYLILQGWGAAGAVMALILGQAGYAGVLLILLLNQQRPIISAVKLPVIKKALLGSLPYGLLGILGLLYFRIDTVLLSYLKGSFETGIYGAAYKFLEAVIFIPGAFSVALFPALAKLHQEDKSKMKKLYYQSLRLMLVIGASLLLIYILVLPEFIRYFLPNYLQAIEVIRILAFSIPFIFLASPGVQVMFSSEKYLKTVVFLSFITVAFNIILNLIFIPQYGFLAAAWITVASDILSFGIFYLLITRRILTDEKS